MRRGVDEAPVSNAGSTIRAFSSEVDTCSREENASNKNPLSRSSVVAGAHVADVVAVGVELANPAAAAIAVIIVAVVRSDRAADHGGANDACSDAPADAPGFRSGGGRSDAAGDSKRGEGESGNSGFDRPPKNSILLRAARFMACISIGLSVVVTGSSFPHELFVTTIL